MDGRLFSFFVALWWPCGNFSESRQAPQQLQPSLSSSNALTKGLLVPAWEPWSADSSCAFCAWLSHHWASARLVAKLGVAQALVGRRALPVSGGP